MIIISDRDDLKNAMDVQNDDIKAYIAAHAGINNVSVIATDANLPTTGILANVLYITTDEHKIWQNPSTTPITGWVQLNTGGGTGGQVNTVTAEENKGIEVINTDPVNPKVGILRDPQTDNPIQLNAAGLFCNSHIKPEEHDLVEITVGTVLDSMTFPETFGTYDPAVNTFTFNNFYNNPFGGFDLAYLKAGVNLTDIKFYPDIVDTVFNGYNPGNYLWATAATTNIVTMEITIGSDYKLERIIMGDGDDPLTEFELYSRTNGWHADRTRSLWKWVEADLQFTMLSTQKTITKANLFPFKMGSFNNNGLSGLEGEEYTISTDNHVLTFITVDVYDVGTLVESYKLYDYNDGWTKERIDIVGSFAYSPLHHKIIVYNQNPIVAVSGKVANMGVFEENDGHLYPIYSNNITTNDLRVQIINRGNEIYQYWEIDTGTLTKEIDDLKSKYEDLLNKYNKLLGE
jgi:hypothetical protein